MRLFYVFISLGLLTVMLFGFSKSNNEVLKDKNQMSVSALSSNPDFQYILDNQKSQRKELELLFSSAGINASGKQQNAKKVDKDIQLLRANVKKNLLIQSYREHIQNLKKGFPNLFSLSRPQFREIVNSAAMSYLILKKSNKRNLLTSDQRDSCYAECTNAYASDQILCDSAYYIAMDNCLLIGCPNGAETDICYGEYRLCVEAAYGDWVAECSRIASNIALCNQDCNNQYPEG